MYCREHIASLLILILFHISKTIRGKTFDLNSMISRESNYDDYYDADKNYTDTDEDNYYSNEIDYEYRNYTSRIRYLKAIEFNVSVTIDIEISIPLSNFGSIDIDIPISISIQNRSLLKIPYPDPPLRVPLFYPIINLPRLPNFLSSSNHHYQQQPQPEHPNQQSYDYYPENQALYEDYFNKPPHQLTRRSLAAQSAQHRFEIFRAIENSLDKHGFAGQSCLLKAICQLAQRELLIESPIHEIIEHLFTVSRGLDENSLLSLYVEAEKFGQNQQDCEQKYVCPFSLFRLL